MIKKKREVYKDRQERVLGYIEHQSDGSLHALNGDFTIIAFYDKRKDETQDPNKTRIQGGNALVDIVTQGVTEWTVTEGRVN